MNSHTFQNFRSVKAQGKAFDAFQTNFLSRFNENSSSLSPNSQKFSNPNIEEPGLFIKEDMTVKEIPLIQSYISKKEVMKGTTLIPFFDSTTGISPSDKLKFGRGMMPGNSETLSEGLSKDLKKRDKKIDTLTDFTDVVRLREKERKLSNHRLLETYITKDGGKVIPFVKRFYFKLKNATSLRNISHLKSSQFKLLSDSTYFYDEAHQREEMLKTLGIKKHMIKFQNLFENQFSQIKSSQYYKSFKNFLKGHKMVIHPYQNFKILWDILYLFLIVVWLYYIPLLMAFEEVLEPSKNFSFWTMVFLIADIFVNFNTAYFKNGVVEKRRKLITHNYIRGKLMLDCITLLPMICTFFNCHLYTLSHVIRYAFFLKISNIKEISHRISEKFLLREKLQNILNLFKILFISILVAHLFACFWYLASLDSHETNSWISKAGLVHSEWNIKYLYSMYWACVTMMTVGYGDITPQSEVEIVICLISVVLGCAVYAYNINSIGMILQDINKENVEFDHKINIINQFMHKKKINQDLQMRIREYLRFLWKEENTQNFEDEQKIIGLLSTSLREELLINAYGSILKKFPMFFANFTEKSLSKVVNIIKDIRLFPEEEIFSENDQENLNVYFIIKGKVELFTDSGIVLKELGVGDLFGEISFFSGKPRKLSARTKDFTTLISIDRDEFLTVLRQNPDDFEKLCMIHDQLVLYDNYFPLKIRCFCCNQIGHIASECQMIHFTADKEKVIKKFNYYLDQERNASHTRKSRKINSLKDKMFFHPDILKIQQLLKEEKAALMPWRDITNSSDNSFADYDIPNESFEFEMSPDINSNIINSNNKLVRPQTSHTSLGNIISDKSLVFDELNTVTKPENEEEFPHSDENIKNATKVPDSHFFVQKNALTMKKHGTLLRQNSNKTTENAIFSSFQSNGDDKSPKIKEEMRSLESCSRFPESTIQRKFDPVFIVDIEKHDEIRQKTHETIIRKNFQVNEIENPDMHRLGHIYHFDEINRKTTKKLTENTSAKNYRKSSSKKTEFKIVGSSKFLEKKKTHSIIEPGEMKKGSMSNLNPEKLMDGFDRVSCFKNYFPENNIKALLESTNKRKAFRRYNKIKQERKKSLELRLSKYTFFPEEMKAKMPTEIHKRARLTLKKSKKNGAMDGVSQYELNVSIKDKDKLLKRKTSTFVRKRNRRYFTTGLFEQKFSDIVKYVMSRPALKKKLKSQR